MCNALCNVTKEDSEITCKSNLETKVRSFFEKILKSRVELNISGKINGNPTHFYNQAVWPGKSGDIEKRSYLL